VNQTVGGNESPAGDGVRATRAPADGDRERVRAELRRLPADREDWLLTAGVFVSVSDMLCGRGVPAMGAAQQAERIARVAALLGTGQSVADVASELGVSRQTVERAIALIREALYGNLGAPVDFQKPAGTPADSPE
jgi:hypothetical protein